MMDAFLRAAPPKMGRCGRCDAADVVLRIVMVPPSHGEARAVPSAYEVCDGCLGAAMRALRDDLARHPDVPEPPPA